MSDKVSEIKFRFSKKDLENLEATAEKYHVTVDDVIREALVVFLWLHEQAKSGADIVSVYKDEATKELFIKEPMIFKGKRFGYKKR